MDFLQELNKIKTALPEGTDTSAIDALGAALQPYQGLDPAKAREAIAAQQTRAADTAQLQQVQAERDQYKTDLQQFKDGNLQLSKELAATRGLNTAGVRPNYEGLLLSQVTGSLEVGEDGKVAAPEGLWDGLKTKYPDMFFAEDGAGTGAASGGTGADETPRAVKATNGLVTGVDPDEVLSGKVKVEMG